MEQDGGAETAGVEQMRAIVAAREVIEQAKGAVMLGFGVDSDQAFAILRAASQAANVKVRDLADTIAAALPGIGARHSQAGLRESLEALLFGVVTDSS
ncbi:ANTAR domain-containing protein [Nocardia takedensis]|uniref:ANTAR domain-containing protein n=1 Tax=Nocardia takedensis TaxID=259390 RepID=UPI003F758F54